MLRIAGSQMASRGGLAIQPRFELRLASLDLFSAGFIARCARELQGLTPHSVHVLA